MADLPLAARDGTLAGAHPRAPVAAELLDWLVAAGGIWILGGGYWDGWAHIHDRPDSFWTVWHAAIYSGFAALALVLLGAVAWNRPIAGSWRAAIPPGYGWALAGVPLFALGGLFDSVWHTFFGIEVSTDALLSPSHLTLAVATVLMVTAPLRADWVGAAGGSGLRRRLPVGLSLTVLFAELQFFSQFAGPYADVFGGGPGRGPQGNFEVLERQLLGVYLYSTLLVGIVLVALRRPPLPLGTLTLMQGATAMALVFMRGDWPLHVELTRIGIALTAGILGDVLLLRWRPSYERVGALRAISFALPAAYVAIYLVVVTARFGTWYTAHALVGFILLSGFVGLLLSYVAAPPRVAAKP